MADERLNLSDCFEEVPATPGSLSVFSVEEFGQASPMPSAFCKRLNEKEYEDQTISETEKALKDLIDHMERNPSYYTQVLRKKKKDEQENAGVVSFLKSRFMTKFQGDRYEKKLVSEEEAKEKLNEVTTGMLMVFNYAKDANQGRRFSKRIAERKGKHDTDGVRGRKIGKSSGRCPAGPPPPPPLPPPLLLPLQDCTNIMSSTPAPNKTVQNLKGRLKRDSAGSISSMQDELQTFDRVKRLKPTGRERSPGFTPKKTPGRRNLNASNNSLDWTLNSSEPLTAAFLKVMEQKFRNVRSPSVKSLDSTAPFSPGEFSP